MAMRNTASAPEAEINLHLDLWTALDRKAADLSAPAGTQLFREGEPVRGVYLLRKGQVRLYLSARNGRSMTYRVVEPPYILGLPATLLHQPYSLSAKVVRDAQLGFVEHGDVMRRLRQRADICMHVLEFLSQEMVWIRHVHAQTLTLRPVAH